MKIGDVVRLKSGGPIMVVTSHDREQAWSTVRRWWCKWFDADDDLQCESFPDAGLEHVDRSEEVSS